MADVAWPASLPQYVLASGYSEKPPESTVRTEMTSGRPKYRRRQTAAVRPIQCQVRLTYTQRATLDAFYLTGTKGGTLPFDWAHPVSRDPVEMMFAAPPTYSPAANAAHIVASLSLEILP